MKAIRTLVNTALAVSLTLPLGGCAGALTHFVVDTRNKQGDSAIATGSTADALAAYKLALDLDPTDEHARSGYAGVQLRIAEKLYHTAKFDDALTTLANAAKYDPQSVRLAELKSEVEAARVKREIVLSNYPTYHETGETIQKSYANLAKENQTIVASLTRFGYTYDSSEITSAIRNSYTLTDELHKLTNRLLTYRQLVEAGAPNGSSEPLSPAASLLPLP